MAIGQPLTASLASVCVIAGELAGGSLLHLNGAIVALLFTATLAWSAALGGRLAALSSVVTASLAFGYFEWHRASEITSALFVVAAVTIGQLAARPRETRFPNSPDEDSGVLPGGELKSAILDALAHEIRNPLHSVKLAATTLLSEQPLSDSSKREMLSIIRQETDRMDRFIDEAIRLASVEAGTLVVNKKPQDVAQLIPAAIEEMGASIAPRDVRLKIPDSLPAADCDKGMIVHVLKQLLNNALKYSPQGSPLALSANLSGSAIVIDVIDQGPGVADDERERIFEKYYRGRTVRGCALGTGLGLASARCIVEAQGGRIWVTNETNGGAAFHVALPVVEAQRAAGAV